MKQFSPIPAKVRLLRGSKPLPRSFNSTGLVKDWRYAACELLTFANITNALWFEDVLAFHGYKGPLSELCLLVDDPVVAASVLMAAGYHRAHHAKRSSFRAGCLGPDDAFLSCSTALTDVILIKAGDWHYRIRIDELHNQKCPWLPRYLDALMKYWLSVPPEEYEGRRTMMDYVANLVAKCYDLDDFGRKVAGNRYASFLNPTHLELHYDIVARYKDIVQVRFEHQERHAYHFRKYQQIKEGRFYPRPYKRNKFYPRLQPLYE